jgi:putative transposase
VEETETLRHTTWDCKYRVVCIPQYRRQALYQELRRHWGDVLRSLAQQKEWRVAEGHLLPDHVHMLLSMPPTDSVAPIVGFIKGKSALPIARPDVHGEAQQLHGAARLGSWV